MSNLALQLARRFEPRHLAIALLAVIASFAVLDLADAQGLTSLRFFDLNDTDLTNRLTISTLVVGLVLLGAAAMAFGAAGSTRTPAQARWMRASGVVFALFAAEEIFGLQAWLEEVGAAWAATYLPALVIALSVWLMSVPALESAAARRAFLGGAGVWLLAAPFDAASTGMQHAYALGELLELSAAALFFFSFVLHAHAVLPPVSAAEGRRLEVASLAELARRLDPVKLGIGALLIVVALGVMGSISHGGTYMRVWDLNKEQNYGAAFSGLALWFAAAMAICYGVCRHESWRDRRWWLVLGFVFLFLGLDEMTAIHEEFQHVTGIWGQSFLAPVVVLGVIGWYKALEELRFDRTAAALLLGGAAFWTVAQMIDLLLNETMPWTVIPEELLEMSGSLLFGFALLVGLQALAARAAAPAVPGVAPALLPERELSAAR